MPRRVVVLLQFVLLRIGNLLQSGFFIKCQSLQKNCHNRNIVSVRFEVEEFKFTVN